MGSPFFFNEISQFFHTPSVQFDDGALITENDLCGTSNDPVDLFFSRAGTKNKDRFIPTHVVPPHGLTFCAMEIAIASFGPHTLLSCREREG